MEINQSAALFSALGTVEYSLRTTIKQSTVGNRQTVEKLHIQSYMTELRLPARKRNVFPMLPPTVCYVMCTC